MNPAHAMAPKTPPMTSPQGPPVSYGPRYPQAGGSAHFGGHRRSPGGAGRPRRSRTTFCRRRTERRGRTCQDFLPPEAGGPSVCWAAVGRTSKILKHLRLMKRLFQQRRTTLNTGNRPHEMRSPRALSLLGRKAMQTRLFAKTLGEGPLDMRPFGGLPPDRHRSLLTSPEDLLCNRKAASIGGRS